MLIKNQNKKTSAFTIVELLIVIVIIGILAAITIVSYRGLTQRSIEASLQSDLKNAVAKLKLYQVDNSAYPVGLDCAAVPAANTICLKASPNNSYPDYSVNNATTPQTFRLVVKNSNNTSYYTTESTPPIAVGVATAPTGLSATGGATQVSLTWAAPTGDGGSTITGYKLYRGTTTNPTTLVQTLGNVTSYTNTGLAAGTNYYFRVQAINATGDSEYSNNASAATAGQQAYTAAGTYSWTAPAGVTSVSVVAVGGGGGGGSSWSYSGGSGGGLGWKNNITVVPGNTYTVVVGAGGTYSSAPTLGNNSYFIDLSTVAGYGAGRGGTGSTGTGTAYGGGYAGDGGGRGGNNNTNQWSNTGSGAAGYSGAGGDNNNMAGSGGGGGSGYLYSSTYGTAGGGGVGILGQGANGAGGSSSTCGQGGGRGGSGGSNGSDGEPCSPGMGNIYGGAYGGGGGGSGTSYGGGNGGVGAVRIIWGAGRAFPSTNTGNM